MYKLRNPWADSEWTGDWSDSSDKWTNELKSQVDLIVDDDGVFFIDEANYLNEFEISTAGKLFGITSAMIGGLIASHIMKKKNLYDSLLMFGSIHAAAHILFVVQEIYGKNIYLLFVITGFESVSGGMSMAAYIAFIASLCRGKFRATQYSFLSSMMGLSRSIFPAISGYIVSSLGWSAFYIFTTLATVPSLIMILYLKKVRAQNSTRRI